MSNLVLEQVRDYFNNDDDLSFFMSFISDTKNCIGREDEIILLQCSSIEHDLFKRIESFVSFKYIDSNVDISNDDDCKLYIVNADTIPKYDQNEIFTSINVPSNIIFITKNNDLKTIDYLEQEDVICKTIIIDEFINETLNANYFREKALSVRPLIIEKTIKYISNEIIKGMKKASEKGILVFELPIQRSQFEDMRILFQDDDACHKTIKYIIDSIKKNKKFSDDPQFDIQFINEYSRFCINY